MYFLDQDFDTPNNIDNIITHPSNPLPEISASRSTIPSISSKPRHKKSRTHQPLKKKHSRMSLVFEKYREKYSIGEAETNYTISIGSLEETIPRHTRLSPALISITVNCIVGEDTVKSINIQVEQDATMCNVIEKSIYEFNKEFHIEQAGIKVKEDAELFMIKPAKKNGKPKGDMPCFDGETILSNAQTVNFALCWKEDQDDYMKMYEKERKKKVCDGGCCLF